MRNTRKNSPSHPSFCHRSFFSIGSLSLDECKLRSFVSFLPSFGFRPRSFFFCGGGFPFAARRLATFSVAAVVFIRLTGAGTLKGKEKGGRGRGQEERDPSLHRPPPPPEPVIPRTQ